MNSHPTISVVVPIHNMKHGDYFLWRLVQSLTSQTFKDYELIITQEGKMAHNTNVGMRKAKGEFIKILYLDDYLAHPNALKEIVDNLGDAQWLATGCLHQTTEEDFYEDPHSPHFPEYTKDISTGNNRIGSPSVITLRNEGKLYFDENMSWLLDADLYQRYYETYGPPKILNDLNVVIGIGDHQMTHNLTPKEKTSEHEYLAKKYG